MTAERYGSRTASSITQRFSDISVDVQTFLVALGNVHESFPTGFVEENIHAMAVSIHMGHTNVISCDNKSFDVKKWLCFGA